MGLSLDLNILDHSLSSLLEEREREGSSISWPCTYLQHIPKPPQSHSPTWSRVQGKVWVYQVKKLNRPPHASSHTKSFVVAGILATDPGLGASIGDGGVTDDQEGFLKLPLWSPRADTDFLWYLQFLRDLYRSLKWVARLVLGVGKL